MNIYKSCNLLLLLHGTFVTTKYKFFMKPNLRTVGFQWIPIDQRFDCIVGITANDTPVGIGTLISKKFLITSANPLEPYLKKKSEDSDEYVDSNNVIKLYAIDKAFDKSKLLEIDTFNGNIAKRQDVWIRMGFNRTHSPIHDLIVITIKEGQVKEPPVNGREAFYLSSNFTSYFTSDWTFAGFGYEDRHHIASSTVLEMSSYEETEEEECDQWIPRPWGRFVCLSNIENYKAIQSGAPLFYQGALRGVGSFELKKGNESILVFTDCDEYSFERYRENYNETSVA